MDVIYQIEYLLYKKYFLSYVYFVHRYCHLILLSLVQYAPVQYILNYLYFPVD